jgi:VWFA-related protein
VTVSTARALLVVSLWTVAPVYGMAQGKTNDLPEVSIRHATYIPPSVAISVRSNLVELGVTVRDGKGRLISGLNASDFELFDDGRLEKITVFSEERAGEPASITAEDSAALPGKVALFAPSTLPESHRLRFITLFVDDDHGELLGLRKSQLAIEKLISAGLMPNDHVAVFTTSGDATLDFTTDRKLLRTAVEGLRPHVHRGDEALTVCPSLTSYQAYVIANNLDLMAKQIAIAEANACNCPPGVPCPPQGDLVDALANSVWNQTKYHSTNALEVLKIAVRHLAQAPEDRILVLISPGFVTGGMEQQTSSIIDAALRNHIVINSLDSEGLLLAGESPEGRRVDAAVRQSVVTDLMSTTAAATGGLFVQNSNDLMGSLSTLATPPEASYNMGFYPYKQKPDEKYHHLKVRLRNGNEYKIQARAGYYYSAAQEPQRAQKEIDREVLSNEELHQLAIAVHVSPSRVKNSEFAIRVLTTVDASHLKFAKQNGRSVQQLTFVIVLRDSHGGYIMGKEAVMDLRVTPNRLTLFRTRGIKTSFSLTAPEGSFEVREVVRELVDGHLAASNTSVQCR